MLTSWTPRSSLPAPVDAIHDAHQSRSSATEPDLVDQLKKLAELRDAGVPTEEEFAAKKADLLARM